MFTISKDHHFSYSHVLDGLNARHPCARLHGHNAIVRLTLESEELNGPGFVVDYGDLKPILNWLDEQFDHRHLNDVVPFNPTAELLSQYAYDEWHEQFPQLVSVAWSETPKTWAVFRP